MSTGVATVICHVADRGTKVGLVSSNVGPRVDSRSRLGKAHFKEPRSRCF